MAHHPKSGRGGLKEIKSNHNQLYFLGILNEKGCQKASRITLNRAPHTREFDNGEEFAKKSNIMQGIKNTKCYFGNDE